MISILPLTLRFLLTTFLWPKEPTTQPQPLTFELRHQHGVSNSSRVIFSDIGPSFVSETFTVNTKHVGVHRPTSFAAFSSARKRSLRYMESEALDWNEARVMAPNAESRDTLVQLAKMTQNAYVPGPEKTSEWYELNGPWNSSDPFGWDPDEDGLRGHIFASTDNSTVVISIKGTSAGWIAGSGGPTVKRDKLNDNLLFSCCCAKVGPTWWPVCDCASGGYTCDQNCLEESLLEESLFYHIGTNLYNNVTYMYPNANIWIIGHSLGGSLASLLGVTFGVPVIAFEAPGERLAASRLHLPTPPSTQHITHIFHTADPVPMGTCTGVTSVCAIGGYAMESRCHLGKVALYDTVSKYGWKPDTRMHGIVAVIENVLHEDWELPDENGEGGREVPTIEAEKDCIDCFNWEFGDYKEGLIDQTV